jgi:hypothetical protein
MKMRARSCASIRLPCVCPTFCAALFSPRAPVSPFGPNSTPLLGRLAISRHYIFTQQLPSSCFFSFSATKRPSISACRRARAFALPTFACSPVSAYVHSAGKRSGAVVVDLEAGKLLLLVHPGHFECSRSYFGLHFGHFSTFLESRLGQAVH